MIFAVARSAATNRPGCQHIVTVRNGVIIASCGYDLTGSSMSYLDEPIPAILCMRCAKIEGRDGA